jgi:4-coumarate--CoA ligase
MITSGAAPLTKELVALVHNKLKLKVNQAYGLSETSPMTHTQASSRGIFTGDCIFVTDETKQPWDDWWSSVGSVGKLFPNMTAKYVSEAGEEVPAGEKGSINQVFPWTAVC